MGFDYHLRRKHMEMDYEAPAHVPEDSESVFYRPKITTPSAIIADDKVTHYVFICFISHPCPSPPLFIYKYWLILFCSLKSYGAGFHTEFAFVILIYYTRAKSMGGVSQLLYTDARVMRRYCSL